jgi:hypothetical protein
MVLCGKISALLKDNPIVFRRADKNPANRDWRFRGAVVGAGRTTLCLSHHRTLLELAVNRLSPLIKL